MLCYFSDINFRACVKATFMCKCTKHVDTEDVVNDTVTGVAYDHQNSEVQVP